MTGPSKSQPALFGGLVAGVLSALPIIGLGNCCCCLWVVIGGVIAAWFMQLNHPYAITIGDGAVAGLLAGPIGACVELLVALPLSSVIGPFQRRLFEQFMESAADLPPGVRESFEAFQTGTGPVTVVIGFVLQLFIGTLFSTLGGLVGTLLVRKGPIAPPWPPDLSSGPPSPPPPLPVQPGGDQFSA